MNESSPFITTGPARRLIVTLVIGTAAAAVTAGVALNQQPPAEVAVEHASAAKKVADTVAPAPVRTRREPWRDPGRRSDPSVPDAAKALESVAGPSSSEPAPTF